MTVIGITQNNPTNIRKNPRQHWMGEETHTKNGFCKFINRVWAYRATFIILHSYVNRHCCRSLRDIIGRWAPNNENNTADYIRFVSNWSNYPEAVTVNLADEDMMCKIVHGMVRMEVGIVENIETIRKGYRLACVSREMKNVKEQ